MVLIGLGLKAKALVTDEFVRIAANLVYRVFMPILLFRSVSQIDLDQHLDITLVGYFTLASFLIILLGWGLSKVTGVNDKDQAVYIQGIFRGNHGVIGLALCLSLYGDEGLQLAGLMAGVATILNNSLSIAIFSLFSNRFEASIKNVLVDIVTNPMIMGVCLGLAFAYFHWTLPLWMGKTADLVGSTSLPLALLGVGASLSLASIKDSSLVTLNASLTKLLIVPLVFTALGYVVGIRDMSLGILFLYLATPTAAVSFILARESGADEKLAANMVVLSTALSIVTITGGLYVLGVLGVLAAA